VLLFAARRGHEPPRVDRPALAAGLGLLIATTFVKRGPRRARRRPPSPSGSDPYKSTGSCREVDDE
jgi:hypothetical protein